MGQPTEHDYPARQSGSSSISTRINLDHEMDDWKDDTQDEMQTVDDIERYIRKIYTDDETNSFNSTVNGEPMFNIAKFWSSAETKHEFPFLSRVALGVLSIPASSASSERVFSTAGRVLEKRRTRLSDKSVDSLLFLHSHHIANEDSGRL